MTLTQTPPRDDIGIPVELLIQEARQRHRRRVTWTALVAAVALASLVGGLYLGGVGRSSPPPRRAAASRSGPDLVATKSTRPPFVLIPSWLPPGFSASGGGYVDPPGGLNVGSPSRLSVSTVSEGSNGGQAQLIPVVFTLNYYGYHNPESKSILLAGLGGGQAPSGPTTVLGGRHVSLASAFKPGYFGGNTYSSAVWIERHLYFNVMAQGISKAELAHFVAALKERPPPPSIRVPLVQAGTSQVKACASLRHSGFECVAQFHPRVSSAPAGTVVATSPAGGTHAPKGSFVTLVVSSSGAASRISSVLGMSPDYATSALRQEGFPARTSCVVASGGDALRTVVTQAPLPGSTVENGSLVQLGVAQRSC